MNAKQLLIAHGEKLAVVLVAGGCAVVLWSSASDASIRPLENLQSIDARNQTIAAGFKSQKPPTMKAPRPYLDDLLGRTAQDIPHVPVMSWLTNPPDKGRGGPRDGLYVYIYELLEPQVAVEDTVGSLRITLTLPSAEKRPESRRVSGEAHREWSRQEGKVKNIARHLGVQFQLSIGDGDNWRPLVLPGASPEGILPLAALANGKALTIPTPEPWQKHRVQARIIAGVTALDLDGQLPEEPEASVVVHAGTLLNSPTDEPGLLDRTKAEVKDRKGDLFTRFLRPTDTPPPSGIRLGRNEKLFLGNWSPVATVTATDSVRFALIGLGTAPLPDNPAKTRDIGRFLLLRLFEQGGQRKWMEKPIELKLGQGDRLEAKDVRIPDPFTGQTVKVNLDTPFVVEKLEPKVDRVLYWVLRLKSRQGGAKGKEFDLEPKKAASDVVMLRNPATGRPFPLARLMNIPAPAQRKDQLIYPHRAAASNERDDFTKAPSDFRQWDLVPEQPKQHQPDTGPLHDLYQAKVAANALDANNYRTDTPYYTFPDKRIAWWDPVAEKLQVHDPDEVGKAAVAAPVVPPKPTAPEAPPEAPPEGERPADQSPPAE